MYICLERYFVDCKSASNEEQKHKLVEKRRNKVEKR